MSKHSAENQSTNSIEGDDLEDYKILEESPCGRWNKSDTEIYVQRLLDFDSTHVGIDTDKGVEIAWNEMKYVHEPSTNFTNRFDSADTLKSIYEKLKGVLEFLLKLDHSNILKFYDYWFTENKLETKVVIITEYSTAGSLKKALDKSKLSQTKVRPSTAKRWLNQILYSVRYLHGENISIFQGYISSETIFIQNSCVIKLTPTLLRLNGVCEMTKSVIRRSASSMIKDKSKPKKMKLTNEIIQKDIYSIGTIALEIFTAHIKSRRSTTPIVRNVSYCEDPLENDFVTKCFEFDNIDIDLIWYHPFINNIYSLKVLSVYGILQHFQEKNTDSKNNIDNLVTHIKSKLISSDEESAPSRYSDKTKASSSDQYTDTDNSSTEEYPYVNTKLLNRTSSSENVNKPFAQNRRGNSTGLLKQRRKVSLSFLSNFNNITIPQDFFSILDDIRYGLYPRLFTESEYKELNTPGIKSITSSTCLEFVMQQKQIIDIRSSLLNINNNFLNDPNERKDLATIVLPSYDEECLNKIDEIESSKAQCSKGLNNDLVKEFCEPRRISSEECFVKVKDDESQMIELNLRFRFDDDSQRNLQCYFPDNFFLLLENFEDLRKEFDIDNADLREASPVTEKSDKDIRTFEKKIENICQTLSNELVDYGLVNFDDKSTINELFFSAIKRHIF